MTLSLTQKLTAHFNALLPQYDRYNSVFLEIGRRLLERCEDLNLNPNTILDLGYGLGSDTNNLQQRFPNSLIYGLDLAWKLPKKHTLLASGDAHTLPFKDASFSLIFMNGPLYWSTTPLTILKECYRVLQPQGVLLFTALGPDTFIELGNSTDAVPLHDLHIYGDWLLSSAFQYPVMDRENLNLTYASITAQKRDCYAFGAGLFPPNLDTPTPPALSLGVELLYGYAVKPATAHQHPVHWQD